MSCCAVAKSLRTRPFSMSGGRSANYVEVLGTWDFKWPLGKCVRVAFQVPRDPTLDDAALDAAVEQVWQLAQTWNEAEADIQLTLAAPQRGYPGRRFPYLPPAPAGHPQNRSGVVLPGYPHEFAAANYDVLVSLEALPLKYYNPLAPEKLISKVFLPESELGSYSRRVDYGVPTLFLGPISKLCQGERSLAEYYTDEAVARFYVVHEFGHVLGLAHEHQNPLRRERDANLKDLPTQTGAIVSRMRTILERRLGLDLRTVFSEPTAATELLERTRPLTSDQRFTEFVRQSIVDEWPGNRAFSDWRDDTEDSVLFSPFWHCLMGANGDQPSKDCVECTAALVERPSTADLRELERIYPKSR